MVSEQTLSFAIAVGLVALMFSTGLCVAWNDLRGAFTPQFVARQVGINFVCVPMLTLGLIWIAAPSPAVALGFLALALTPGAPVAPPLTRLAGGDTSVAIGQMVTLGLLSVVLAPILLGWLAPQILPGPAGVIPVGRIIRTLLLVQILPLLAGIAVHQRNAIAAERWAPPFRLVGNVLLLFVLSVLIGPAWTTLSIVRLRGWGALLALLATSLFVGAIWSGRAPGVRVAGAISAAVRNVAAAMVLANAIAPSTLAVPTVLAYGLFSTLAVLGWAIVSAGFASLHPVANSLTDGPAAETCCQCDSAKPSSQLPT